MKTARKSDIPVTFWVVTAAGVAAALLSPRIFDSIWSTHK